LRPAAFTLELDAVKWVTI